MKMQKIKILLVDDHYLVRQAIEQLFLEKKEIHIIDIIASTDSGEEAVKIAREQSPDIVLMDLQMPGINGFEAARKMLAYRKETKIIMMSSLDEDIYSGRWLDIGVMGYITKESGTHEILRAIHAVSKGQKYITPRIAHILALKKIDPIFSIIDKLTNKELQVLLMLTAGHTVEQIAEKLFLNLKTIHAHRYNLYKKLHVENDVQLVLLATQLGLLKLIL